MKKKRTRGSFSGRQERAEALIDRINLVREKAGDILNGFWSNTEYAKGIETCIEKGEGVCLPIVEDCLRQFFVNQLFKATLSDEEEISPLAIKSLSFSYGIVRYYSFLADVTAKEEVTVMLPGGGGASGKKVDGFNLGKTISFFKDCDKTYGFSSLMHAFSSGKHKKENVVLWITDFCQTEAQEVFEAVKEAVPSRNLFFLVRQPYKQIAENIQNGELKPPKLENEIRALIKTTIVGADIKRFKEFIPPALCRDWRGVLLNSNSGVTIDELLGYFLVMACAYGSGLNLIWPVGLWHERVGGVSGFWEVESSKDLDNMKELLAYAVRAAGLLQGVVDDALAGIGIYEYASKSEWAKKASIESGKKSATAAFVARNMSHNLGSHVLANVTLKEIKENPEEVFHLQAYLQQRMDFVARVTTEWPPWREPLFFYGDLLDGFFRQGLLFRHLVKDNGYMAKNMEFIVRTSVGSTPGATQEVVWKPSRPTPRDDNGGGEGQPGHADAERILRFSAHRGYEDFLVALPGGPIGRQAFYGLLENAIRNAAKHGVRTGDGQLKVLLEVKLSDDGTSYQVTYTDNLSRNDRGGGKPALVTSMEKSFRIPPVDPVSGKRTDENWGLQEMKIYADFLIHPSDRIWQHEEDGTKYPIWPVLYEDKGCKEGFLAYTFALQKPVLILIVENEPRVSDRGGLLKKMGVEFVTFPSGNFDALKKAISRASPEILLFVPHTGKDKTEMCRFIEAERNALPGRILVAGKTRGEARGVPPGVQIVPPPQYPEVVRQADWEDLLLGVFASWVRSVVIRKTGKGAVSVKICFDEGKDFAGFTRWRALCDSMDGCTHFEFLGVELQSQRDGVVRRWGANSGRESAAQIVFDNHRRFEENLPPGGIDFYQVIGHDTSCGINNSSSFDQLNNVAQGFTGQWFLLKLVESSLMDVLIIDERLARHVTEGVKGGRVQWKPDVALSLTRARLSLVLSFHSWEEGSWQRKWLLKDEAAQTAQTLEDEKESSREGVYVKNGRATRIIVLHSFHRKEGYQYREIKRENPVDAIVIHWGWLEEEFEGQTGGASRIGTFLDSLKALAGRIFITSGRGVIHEIPAGFPFVEVSLMEDSLMRELSKFHYGSILPVVLGKEFGK